MAQRTVLTSYFQTQVGEIFERVPTSHAQHADTSQVHSCVTGPVSHQKRLIIAARSELSRFRRIFETEQEIAAADPAVANSTRGRNAELVADPRLPRHRRSPAALWVTPRFTTGATPVRADRILPLDRYLTMGVRNP